MANLTAQGTVDGALGSSHYTAAMSMVFTHGLEMPETVSSTSVAIQHPRPDRRASGVTRLGLDGCFLFFFLASG